MGMLDQYDRLIELQRQGWKFDEQALYDSYRVTAVKVPAGGAYSPITCVSQASTREDAWETVLSSLEASYKSATQADAPTIMEAPK